MLSSTHVGPQSQTDRAAQMPLLGFLTGLTLALVLWSAVGWLIWLLLD